MIDLLKASLRDLAASLKTEGITLTVVGGYGLVLRAEEIQRTVARTLGGTLPLSRSTEDLDCFLDHTIISNASHTERIRLALDTLGYRVIAEHLIFERPVQTANAALIVRIDLMAAPVPEQLASRVISKDRRIRSVGYDRLHGRLTPEAVFVSESPMAVDISADGSGLIVHLPNAYAFLVLKLFALRDGPHSKAPDRANRHALDLYSIWAAITESEYKLTTALRDSFWMHPISEEARSIVRTLFGGDDATGMLSLRIAARESGIPLEAGSLREFERDLFVLLGAA